MNTFIPWMVHYPYQNLEMMNLDWLTAEMDKNSETLKNFVNLNTIKYADPILWNITTQYETNTVVVDPVTGTAYISVQPVPSGIGLNNTDYWTVIFTMDIMSANKNITLRDDANNPLATFESSVGDWVITQGNLYVVTRQIDIGEAYVADYNIERKTVELFLKDYISYVVDMIGDLTDLDTTDKTNLVAAINEVITNIGALSDLDTTDQSSIVNAINEVLDALTNTTGDLSDLDTSDKTNLVAAINEVLTTVGNLVGDLTDLDTTDKSSIVNAINELVTILDYSLGDIVTPQMFGAVGDGVTDDSAAINAAIATGKPVKFISNYAIANTIVIDIHGSRCIDCNGFILTALSGMTGYMVDLNSMYGWIRNMTLNGNLLTTLTGAMLIHSTANNQAQFYLIDNLYTLNCVIGVSYGDGYTNAQSEFTIHAWRTRSVIRALDVVQPNGMLWITDSHLDVTPYEWVSTGITPPADVDPYVFRQYVGGLCFDNCTLESPSYSDRSMVGYDFTLTNCIIEIAGINIQAINYYQAFATEIVIENCKFYESQSSSLITVGGGYTDVTLSMSNCKVYGSAGALIYATTNIKCNFDNVDSTKTIDGWYIIVEKCISSKFGSGDKRQLKSLVYSGVKFVKGSKQYLATIKVTCSAAASLVASYCKGGSIVGSETIVTTGGAGTFYYTINKFNENSEVFQLGTTNGTIDEVMLYTYDDGQGFTKSSIPANPYYPSGALVGDSSGNTAGWVIAGGHITAI